LPQYRGVTFRNSNGIAAAVSGSAIRWFDQRFLQEAPFIE